MPRRAAAGDQLPKIVERLQKAYPNPRVELDFATPLQLLVASILAARCRDTVVNQVTPALFARFPDARAFATAKLTDIENLVLKIPACRIKARAIQECCKIIVERFGGEVPRNIDDLVTLPRVGRKTANMVITQAYSRPSGFVVDTHVERVTQRLGLTKEKKGEKIEAELLKRLPEKEWIHFGAALVLHGRYVCTAVNPKCPECVLNDLCPKIGVKASKKS
ncbi:endonuclease III [Planctomycetaceae bacterium SCGC AG-212-F19]|nr:endonuclease III [Planctomycetaceae bacterium SCGC AG-212-F19]